MNNIYERDKDWNVADAIGGKKEEPEQNREPEAEKKEPNPEEAKDEDNQIQEAAEPVV